MDWPTALPAPTGSFSGDVQSNVVRITMESSRVRQRRRFSGEQRFFSVAWELSDAQLETFESFVAASLNQGADWFTISLPLGATFKSVYARLKGGEYTVGDNGGVLRWRVSATLEVENAAVS